MLLTDPFEMKQACKNVWNVHLVNVSLCIFQRRLGQSFSSNYNCSVKMASSRLWYVGICFIQLHPVCVNLWKITVYGHTILNFHYDVFSSTTCKGKAIPETGREDPQGSEKSRFPHFQDNRLRDGGEVVSPTRQPPFTPEEDVWYSFLLEAESIPGP
jgi:hypothetical protein